MYSYPQGCPRRGREKEASIWTDPRVADQSNKWCLSVEVCKINRTLKIHMFGMKCLVGSTQRCRTCWNAEGSRPWVTPLSSVAYGFSLASTQRECGSYHYCGLYSLATTKCWRQQWGKKSNCSEPCFRTIWKREKPLYSELRIQNMRCGIDPLKPDVQFDKIELQLRNVWEVLRTARSNSTPRPSGVTYKAYKNSLKFLLQLRKVLRLICRKDKTHEQWKLPKSTWIPQVADDSVPHLHHLSC